MRLKIFLCLIIFILISINQKIIKSNNEEQIFKKYKKECILTKFYTDKYNKYQSILLLNKNRNKELIVIATMYHANRKQCDDTPDITASGLKINPYTVSKYNYIAISWNLHKRYGGKFNFYDTVFIKNAGHKSNKPYIIVDLMNKRWKNKIDFLESIDTPIYKFDSVVLAYY